MGNYGPTQKDEGMWVAIIISLIVGSIVGVVSFAVVGSTIETTMIHSGTKPLFSVVPLIIAGMTIIIIFYSIGRFGDSPTKKKPKKKHEPLPQQPIYPPDAPINLSTISPSESVEVAEEIKPTKPSRKIFNRKKKGFTRL